MLLAAGLAVGGISGCSGPGVFSGSAESPSVFARFHDRLSKDVDEPAGRAYVCSAERPARSAADAAAAAIAADDPFTVTPRTPPATTTPQGQIGVARVNDGRLPPAAPLGATNPFSRTRESMVSSPSAGESGRAGSSAMPTFHYASRTRRNAGDTQVPHDDMIVDSAAIPQRAIWRNDVQPRSSATRSVDYAIVPRRPFLSAETLADATPVSTANLPVEIMADGSIENYQTAFTQSSSSVELGAPALTEPEAPAPPVDEPLVPVADPAFAEDAPVFADEAPVAAGDETEPGELSSGPTLALVSPGAVAKMAPPPPATSAVVEATPTPLAIYSGQSDVKPVEIVEGDRAAARQAAERSTFWLNKPLAIGLVLAFVATGAVIIRRRFI
ncbi:MAG: hypothetical protein WBC44_04255 [Planctomycetaceae bacterium]